MILIWGALPRSIAADSRITDEEKVIIELPSTVRTHHFRKSKLCDKIKQKIF